jgi:hypothetical protein
MESQILVRDMPSTTKLTANGNSAYTLNCLEKY